MTPVSDQPWSARAWELTRQQHGVITHAQLIGLGMGPEAIRHRLSNGRLHRLMRGVYAVGRPDIGKRGMWMAGVLACGPAALLSHRSAAALWGIRKMRTEEETEVVIPAGPPRRYPGVRAHRRRGHEAPGRREVDRIPVTHPVATLVDLASCTPPWQVEAAVNEADHLELIDPEMLRGALDSLPRWPGVGRLRKLLQAPTITLTSTQLERRFLPLALEAGLPSPVTQAWLNGYRVDFFWPDLGLVVEADSLRYHRTTFKQARDKRRDNAHATSGLTTLRFTHSQICHEPQYVRRMLIRAAQRLRAQLPAPRLIT